MTLAPTLCSRCEDPTISFAVPFGHAFWRGEPLASGVIAWKPYSETGIRWNGNTAPTVTTPAAVVQRRLGVAAVRVAAVLARRDRAEHHERRPVVLGVAAGVADDAGEEGVEVGPRTAALPLRCSAPLGRRGRHSGLGSVEAGM